MPNVQEPRSLGGSITVRKGQEVIYLQNDNFSFFDGDIVAVKKGQDNFAHKTLHHDQFYQIYRRTDRTVSIEIEKSKTHKSKRCVETIDADVFEFQRIYQKPFSQKFRDIFE